MTDPVSRCGGVAARRFSRLGALARFGFRALGSGLRLTAAGGRVALKVTRNQIAEMSRRPYRPLTDVKPVSAPGATDTRRGGGAPAASPQP